MDFDSQLEHVGLDNNSVQVGKINFKHLTHTFQIRDAQLKWYA